MRYAVIIAGGAGTRLWPMSRTSAAPDGTPGKPKQLLRFIPSPAPDQPPLSLLQLAANRLRGLIEPQHIYICTAAAYASQILEELPLLPASQLLGEPVGRDTANAVGFPAAILAKRDPDASFAVLTADHIIEPVDIFQAAMKTAFDAVDRHPEFLLTFGITPTHPATGYGYIQQGLELPGSPGVYRVAAFKEKPTLDVAQHFLAQGNFSWNAGMFVWKAKTILDQLRQHLPASYVGLTQIAAAWDTPQQNQTLNALYPTLPKISIDIGVMEKAPNVAMVPMNVRWLDVGSWPAFAQTLTPDQNNNRTSAGTLATHLLSSNILAVSENAAPAKHLIATINCHDLIIIHTPNATLVCPAADAEKIKQLVAEVEKQHGKQYT